MLFYKVISVKTKYLEEIVLRSAKYPREAQELIHKGYIALKDSPVIANYVLPKDVYGGLYLDRYIKVGDY